MDSRSQTPLHSQGDAQSRPCPAALAALAYFVIFSCSTMAADVHQQPNILIIVADDLGWGDVGYHGSKIATPNIDRLAKEGVRLENFHVAPLCSPTRAGLMTGRWPIRHLEIGRHRRKCPPGRTRKSDSGDRALPSRPGPGGGKKPRRVGTETDRRHAHDLAGTSAPQDQGHPRFHGRSEGLRRTEELAHRRVR